MAQVLKAAWMLCLTVGLPSIALGQQQQRQPEIFGHGAMLFKPDVRKDLKLGDEQIDKLKDALGKVMVKYKDDFVKFQKMPPTPQEALKLTKAFEADSQKAIASVLDARQLKRFKQIRWQISFATMEDSELQKELKLSEEQKRKVDAILGEALKEVRDLQTKRETSPEKYETVRKKTEEKINGMLSAEQKKKLKELKGPPFEFSRPAPPPAEKR